VHSVSNNETKLDYEKCGKRIESIKYANYIVPICAIIYLFVYFLNK